MLAVIVVSTHLLEIDILCFINIYQTAIRLYRSIAFFIITKLIFSRLITFCGWADILFTYNDGLLFDSVVVSNSKLL